MSPAEFEAGTDWREEGTNKNPYQQGTPQYQEYAAEWMRIEQQDSEAALCTPIYS